MLKTILSITGRPGLYKLVSQGRNMLIVESISDKKRSPAYGTEKVVSLGDIAMYTQDGEKPLGEVLTSIKTKENGVEASIDPKKASVKELSDYFEQVLPNYDHDRVYTVDIKKLISWYNLLIKSGYTEFEAEQAEDAKAGTIEEEALAPKLAEKKPVSKKTAGKGNVASKGTTRRVITHKATARKAGDK